MSGYRYGSRIGLTRRGLLSAPASLACPAVSRATTAGGLDARARAAGLLYGCAVSAPALSDDPALMEHVAAEAGMVVAEYAFKWAALHPGRDSYDWTDADALVAFAASRGLRVRGHTLVWHASNPAWLAGALTGPATAELVLREHIATVVGRYRGRIAQWDVVNEPLRPEDRLPFALRPHSWWVALGPAYLDIAFDACRAADPRALRVLNEFGVDYAIPWQARRRNAVLALLANLTARKVPVDALGIQAHLDASETSFVPAVMTRFLDDVHNLGLKVIVTELDVRDDRLTGDIAARDAAVAAHAEVYLRTVLAHEAVLGVMTWGLSDKGSWLNTTFPRADGLAQRPLPLDAGLARKPMWHSMAEVFDTLASAR